MKTGLLIFVGLITISVHAKSRISIPEYTIVSDVFDSSLPKGTCVVGGKVIYNEKGLSQSLIATTDFNKQSVTDTSGMFRLVLSDKDSAIFFFHTGYGEIIIPNYDFKSQHVVTIKFTPQINYMLETVDKPVIYCYSEVNVEATIQFTPKSNLTFTYPQYAEKGWNISVDRNGITNLADHKNYPYLFWEGETTELNYTTTNQKLEGYLIKTDTCIAFLENTLTAYGLNDTEQADFITFWGPRLVQKEYALIQFIANETYAQEIAEMTIYPEPDALLRLFMFFTPLDEPTPFFTILHPEIPSFKREGFTVVEWGGSEINLKMNYTAIINH